MKVYKHLANEEVKVINGIFKGITGYPEQIETSCSENSSIHIRVKR